jgi:hypothetical protein
MHSANSQPPKKPYHRPRLVVYGSVRDLTRGGAGRKADGGTILGRNRS